LFPVSGGEFYLFQRNGEDFMFSCDKPVNFIGSSACSDEFKEMVTFSKKKKKK
jgi:hypothetical protein